MFNREDNKPATTAAPKHKHVIVARRNIEVDRTKEEYRAMGDDTVTISYEGFCLACGEYRQAQEYVQGWINDELKKANK